MPFSASASEYRILKFADDTYCLREGSVTSDGRYALGWTVQPAKGEKTVDWSILSSTDFTPFIKKYLLDDTTGRTFEGLANVVLDLKAKKSLGKLDFEDPWFIGRNHGGFYVTWGPETDGRRFGVVVNDAKWAPMDLVLIEVSSAGLQQTPILEPLDTLVGKFISAQAKKKKGHPDLEAYSIDFPISDLPETGVRVGFLQADVVGIPFSAVVPKSEEDPSYDGIVTAQLSRAKGKPIIAGTKITEVKAPEGLFWNDPMEDAAIAKADHDLNAAYGQLRKKLSAAQRETLQTEQRAWLTERDALLEKFDNNVEADDQEEGQRILRDRALREMIEKRTQELRSRMKP